MKLKDVVKAILSSEEIKVLDEEIIETIALLANEAFCSKQSNLEALKAIAGKYRYTYVSTLSQRKG